MKKLVSIILCISMLMVLPFNVSAAGKSDDGLVIVSQSVTEVGGGVIIKTIWSEPNLTRASSGSKPARATTEYKSVLGVEWTYTIGGNFSWNGTTATASDAWDDYEVLMSGWTCTGHSVYASRATVYGSASFHFSAGLNKNLSPTLTCSPTGTFS